MCGKTILKLISKLIEKNYKINLYYIGLDNPDIAIERIKNRVLRGGHNISDRIVYTRYYESIKNFEKIISLCDNVNIFDNTKKITEILIIKNNNVKEEYSKLV